MKSTNFGLLIFTNIKGVSILILILALRIESVIAQELKSSIKFNHTVTVFYNPKGKDQSKYRFESETFYMTYLTEIAISKGVFEVGAFLGRTRASGKTAGFLNGNRHLNYGISLEIIPLKIVEFGFLKNSVSTIQLYGRVEMHVYKDLNFPRVRSNRYLYGYGPGIRLNITRKIAINYEYIFNTFNENRFGLNYFIRR